jgi:hypothetical protein
MTPTTVNLFRFFLPLVPVALVWLAGAVIAVNTWRRHPGVSAVALLGCLVLLFTLIAGNVAQYWIIQLQMVSGWSVAQVQQMLTLLAWARTGLSLAGYVLLLWAVFGWRGQVYRPPPLDLRLPPRQADEDHPLAGQADFRKAGSGE